MAKGNDIRRAQLISPFGVGSMYVQSDGTSVIVGGLDHWFESIGGNKVNKEEFKIEELRLTRASCLNIHSIYQPPESRTSNVGEAENRNLFIPALRFPRWHSCSRCGTLKPHSATDPFIGGARDKGYNARCDQPIKGSNGKQCGGDLVQVRFVAVCSHGHIRDFPWQEWVHREANPDCGSPLKIENRTGTGLSAIHVRCQDENCPAHNRSRSLSEIMSVEPDGTTHLSRNLCENGQPFLCDGQSAWLGRFDENSAECDQQLRAILRGASSIYSSMIKSALFVPLVNSAEQLHQLFQDHYDNDQNWQQQLAPGLLGTMYANAIANNNDGAIQQILNMAQGPFQQPDYRERVEEWLDENGNLNEAFREELRLFCENLWDQAADDNAEQEEDETVEVLSEVAEYYEEYRVLRDNIEDKNLVVRKRSGTEYTGEVAPDTKLSDYVSSVSLIDRLRETRVLYGFSRIDGAPPPPPPDLEHQPNRYAPAMQMLRRKNIYHQYTKDWLPGYQVFGEGIFIQFNKEKIDAWEQSLNEKLNAGIAKVFEDLPYYQYYRDNQDGRFQQFNLTPRYVLLHTISHLLINRLIFESGYSSSALKERIYVSTDSSNEMRGLLIYTASGDSEGSMGGLVRMGNPGTLERVFKQALKEAGWCSTDPVCGEGVIQGQGPHNCNGAACHNCALLPETVCERFNAFLDRTLVVGTMEHPEIGFFS
jgi:hypothetical protein